MTLEELYMEAELAPTRKKAQKILKKARKKELLENDSAIYGSERSLQIIRPFKL